MATNAHDSHGGPFVPSGPTHNLPYEPDKFDLKPILAVPVAVIVTTILAYVTTQLIFDNVFGTHRDDFKAPSQTEIGAEFGKKPLNDRLRSISSNDPNAEFQQPRLEAFQTKAQNDRPGTFPVTAEMTTQQALKNDPSNTKIYHPEDLRADRWKELTTYAKKEGNTAQIPITKAFELLLKNNMLPTLDKAPTLDALPKWDRAKESNGGQRTTERK